MRIGVYLPKIEKVNNGPMNFGNLLINKLKAKHEIILNEIVSVDVFYTNFCILNMSTAEKIHDMGIPILCRTDGASPIHRPYSLHLKKIVDTFVFQSEYCKQCFEEITESACDNSRIIYNGTAPKKFIKKKPLSLFLYGKVYPHREPHKYLKEMQHITQVWCKQNNVKFTFHVKGKNAEINHDTFTKNMDSTNIFVHTVNNDPAPNTIIEAMMASNPVIALKNGGSPELTCRELIVNPKNIATELPKRLNLVKKEYDTYSKKCYDLAATKFDINIAHGKYEEELIKLGEKNVNG